MKEKICEQIREYIANEVLSTNNNQWDDDTDIISSGLLDSLSTVKLLVFVEDNFDISFDDSLELDNFKSVNTIANIVYEKVKDK